MNAYIKREDAIRLCQPQEDCETEYRHAVEIEVLLKMLPSADVVEVVRCGECKHMNPKGKCTVFADSTIRPSVSDFCSYGERKDK